MIGNWLKRKAELKANKLAEEDILRVISILKGMSDYEMGSLVATATMLRIQLRENGVVPDELFDIPEPEKSFEFGQVLNALGELIRKYQSCGEEGISAGMMVWHQSLRAIGMPEIRLHGKRMWNEIKRGFPHAESHWETLSLTGNQDWGEFPISEIPFIPKQLNEKLS
ncbi:hypothetical protein P4B35_22055 [Pontiellaceae bacterium B12227]|nr:hypothetical protein [Pontiellaceae bacterium B12227]